MRSRTARYSVPGSPIDDVVVHLKVVIVAYAAVRIGHGQVGGGVDSGQPAEETIVCGGGVLLGGPVLRAVERVGDHKLTPMEVGAQHKWNVLHPVDDSTCLRSNLEEPSILYH